MNKILMICLYLILGFDASAGCDLKTPNDIFNLIKNNHPRFLINNAKNVALTKSINVANQRPNPGFSIESSVGDSNEGSVYTTSASLKHTFELGGKRNARVNVAKESVTTGIAITIHENQQILVNVVLKMHRLRQVYELIPLYIESLNAFNKILSRTNQRNSLSPEQQVERETLSLASNAYKLRISQLNSEKISLNMHLLYYIGKKCTISQLALPYKVNLNEEFKPFLNIKNYSKVGISKNIFSLANAKLALEKANSYPDLEVGVKYDYQKINLENINSVGLTLTMDIPLFNTNKGGRAKAAKEIVTANLNQINVQKKSILDLEAWISKYNQYKKSLKTIANKTDLEKKHKKIEALFKRGIISTSLVIESHRQLIEFTNTRFEFEVGAIEALWNIYKFNGSIEKMKL